MTVADSRSISRRGQALLVETRIGSGAPPSFSPWHSVPGAKVERIELNGGGRSSQAVIWLPEARWDYRPASLAAANMLRITTAEPAPADRSVLFQGFITAFSSSFTGGSGSGESFSAASERCGRIAKDYRWLLSVTSVLFGQIARGPDDYTSFGTSSAAPIDDRYRLLSGRRCIFNQDGRPDRDPEDLVITDPACEIPIFTDPDRGRYWTARDMIRYILSPPYNAAYDWLPIPDPADLVGLDDDDFDRILSHVVVDRLSAVEALDLICRQLGWSFREQYAIGADPQICFFKVGSAARLSRTSGSTVTLLHDLHAPAAGEAVSTAVAAGRKMLWSMSLSEDISAIVNKPYGLGAPDRFEFTAELVPAWPDDDLVPDTSESLANLYFTDADLQDQADPDSKSFYKYYHLRGAYCLRTVGRRWSLNESGRYSLAPFDRGVPFDFSTVIDSKYIEDADGRRLYAPFNRRLLPALTRDKDSLTSVGIKVEFSFDGGDTWQVIPCAISSLPDECGIWIAEPNLAELVDKKEGVLSGGDLDGVQLNFFTSLADDKLEARSFKTGQWYTRVRVTASVQLDRRLARRADSIEGLGSPFPQIAIYDFSDRYGIVSRTAASIYLAGDLDADETDSSDQFDKHLESIRRAYQDPSISGLFVLDRLWLGDGRGRPDFLVGDGIDKITGRNYRLARSSEGRLVYPEIVRIVYWPDRQKTELVTRDLRFVEVPV